MRVGLVLNGEPPSNDDLKLLDSCDAVVCADGAAQSLLKAGRPPTIIVGDLDSLDPEAYKWADALDVPIERHPPQKDLTDGELALAKALEYKPQAVLFLGAHGLRTSMFLANIKLVRTCFDKGLDAIMIGRRESIRYVSAREPLLLTGQTGAILNLLPIDGPAVVSIKGTAFDGDDLTIANESARGLSNVVEADGAQVTVTSGLVLAIVEKPASARSA